ncbi:MAG: methionyl-tRNA formyltransferase [Bacteroidota bacterium]
MRVIFMGTPEFAVDSLKTLVENDVNVVAVITAPDKPKGRGKALGTSPVKDYAVSKEIPLLQPVKLKDPDFLEELRGYEADLQVVVAFRMLPEVVWSMPPMGTFNLHASLLPQYRGAAPINWAIINGEKKTGITTFFLQQKIDTGKIIFQEEEPITDDDTIGDLYERLMKKGAKLVLKTVRAIEEGNYEEYAQEEEEDMKKAPKIFKHTCEINWGANAETIRNFIRGLSPYPAAWTIVGGLGLKVFETEHASVAFAPNAGEFETDGKSYLHVGTGDGVLSITSLQLEGKRRMNIKEFLAGNSHLFA